jgi:lipoprotein-releasing system permease protein|tara:strand:- start:281 stop:1528 length:1248 start_codon:yes stop_codon:yes gene_type:complete
MYKFFEWQIIKSFLKRKQGDMAYSIISILSLLGISLAVAVIITVMSVMNGFQIEIQEKMLNLIPHATIKNINNKSNVDLLNSILDKKQFVESHSVFVNGEAIAITDSNFNAIQIKAYSKEASPIKNKLTQLMIEGQVNDLYDKSFNVIIGKGLSEQLKIKFGDKITFMTQDNLGIPLGSIPRVKQFKVTGIFESGVFEFDQNLVFTGLKDAQLFFQMGDRFSGTDVEYHDPNKASFYTRQIAIESGGGFLISDWTRENPSFFRSLELTKRIIFIVLILILAIACFNIISSLTMLVRQKRSNIAVIRSLGVQQYSIHKIFLAIGFFLGSIGSALGIIIGFLITTNLSTVVHFIEEILSITLYQPEIYFLNELPTRIDWSEVLIICSIAIILSMLSAFIPSYNASKIDPSELLKLYR